MWPSSSTCVALPSKSAVNSYCLAWRSPGPNRPCCCSAHHHHQATARRNRRCDRATVVPFPKGHLHQRLARRIDCNEALNPQTAAPPAAGRCCNRVGNESAPLANDRHPCPTPKRRLASAGRAVTERPVSSTGRSRRKTWAIVQPQQIHPLGADCISGLVVGIEPNGERADHLVCFFSAVISGERNRGQASARTKTNIPNTAAIIPMPPKEIKRLANQSKIRARGVIPRLYGFSPTHSRP